jgi:hypothetical protein
MRSNFPTFAGVRRRLLFKEFRRLDALASEADPERSRGTTSSSGHPFPASPARRVAFSSQPALSRRQESQRQNAIASYQFTVSRG